MYNKNGGTAVAFENIIGNDKIKKLLQDNISTNNILHSYLFSGKKGIGKMLFAREFAKEILCTDQKQITQYNQNNHPDFLIVKPDGNCIKIDQIRMLQNKIAEKPIESNRKVYIIDDAELMRKEAQNCLLKTLEEPPEYAIIILVCSNENLLLSTIKSRCTKIMFSDIQKEKLLEYIDEDIVDLADGSIGRAIQLRESKEIYENIKQVFENIEKCDKIDFIRSAEVIYKSKDNIQEILELANIVLCNKAKENAKYINCIKFVEKAKTRLKQNANYDMTIDDLCFSLWEEINENNNWSKI